MTEKSLDANSNIAVESLLEFLNNLVTDRKACEIEFEILKAEAKTTESRVKMRALKRRIKSLSKESSSLVSDLLSIGVKSDEIKSVVNTASLGRI